MCLDFILQSPKRPQEKVETLLINLWGSKWSFRIFRVPVSRG